MFPPHVTAAEERPAPPIAGGVVAVWLQSPAFDRETVLKMPVVKGGQVVVQWEQVEIEKGKYNFAALETQLADYARLKLPVTIQLNGNRKPHYLFDEVPYVTETREVPGFRQVENREGTLMFWHPAHERAYVNCLTALRDYLAKSPYRSSVLGLRMNFNPFGTEIVTLFPPAKATEYAPKDRWLKPPGLDATIPYNGYNRQDSLDYVRRIMRKHIDLFSGVIPMFIRCTVDSEVLREFAPYLENGTFGIFETGSGFAPFATKAENEEEWIYKYCKTGKTIGYAESFADAWGGHTVKDEFIVSPPQAMYWRVLCDLHKGVSYLAVYGRDLNVALSGKLSTNTRSLDGKPGQLKYDDLQSGFHYQHEFSEALLFANQYAGLHASPARAPGAWIAFRESDAVGNARSPNQKLKLPAFTGDYTYFIERLPDKSTGVMKLGPDESRYGAYARRLPANEAMHLKVDPRFVESLKHPCQVLVIYYDDEAGATFSVSANGQTWKVTTRGVRNWETAAVDVAEPSFPTSADGSRVVIQNGDAPIALHMLTIDRK